MGIAPCLQRPSPAGRCLGHHPISSCAEGLGLSPAGSLFERSERTHPPLSRPGTACPVGVTYLLNCSWCPCGGEADFSAPLRPNILIRRMGPGVFSPFILQDCWDNLWTSVESDTGSQGTICRPAGIPGVRAAGALRGFLRRKGQEKVPLPPGVSGGRVPQSERVSLLGGG